MLALTLRGVTEYVEEQNRDDAMRRYWQGKTGGDATASLSLVLDPPPEPTHPVRMTGEAGTVSEIAVERIRWQEEKLAQAGFSLPPPIYAPGSRVKKIGEDNFRIERTRVEELPVFADAAARIQHEVRNERRRDVEVAAREIRMQEDGSVLLDGSPVRLERDAFQQLAMLAGFGNGARYLADGCDTPLRATNVNAQLQRGGRRRLKVRTRGPEDARTVFATVTPTYASVDTDEVLASVLPELRDAHVEARYDGSGVAATALFMPDEVVDLAAGDIFKAGVRLETDDTGRGRIRVAAVVWRNRCLNLIIIAEGEVETVSFVHRGSSERILEELVRGVAVARSKVADFLEAWGHARKVTIDAASVLKEWVEERTLALPGVRSEEDRDQVVEHLLAAWRKEPEDTLAGAVNAVTRAAHETTSWPIDFREELERQASRLVLVPR